MTLLIRPDASRRVFLRQAGALAALGAGAPLALNLAAMSAASAQTAPDYKALVCVFLFGGNDSYNMVLPTDAASWNAYSAVRNQASDHRSAGPGTTPNAGAAAGSPARLGRAADRADRCAARTFALHPMLGTLQTMFDTDRRLAIAQRRPLVLPTTWRSTRRPASEAGQPVFAQRPAEHLAELSARRRHGRLGRFIRA
jgi:uncharacterized protein (DUF1501 family)